ncbi:MAG: diguanylate cyclase, partial [Peptostreptococcaceae bacterium]|nr:diguanylate cyclase [Peptostreptococcaceae bacterium]
FDNLDINALIIFNKDNAIVDKLFYDLNEDSYTEFPKELLDEAKKLITSHSADQQGVQIVIADSQYYIISFSQITDTHNLKPTDGTMVFARVIDKTQLTHIESEINAKIFFASERDLDEDDIKALREAPIINGLTYITKISYTGNETLSNVIIQDGSKTAAPIIVNITKTRDFYLNSMKQLLKFQRIFILLILLMSFIIYIILNKYISRPLQNMSKELLSISLDKEKFDRMYVYGNNELSDFGTAINNMLSKIESTQLEYKISEKRFRIMFEEAPLGIGLFDFKSGIAEQTNKKFKEIIGRSEESMLEFDWQTISHQDDIAENQRFRDLMLTGEITGFKMRKRYYKLDGQIIWVNLTISLLNSINELNPKELCMIEDISEQVKQEEKILYLSNVDVLTNIYNRRFFETEKTRLDIERQLPLSVIVLDIDGLKLINDSFGYSTGDNLLIAAASIIKTCCRTEDIVARVGGDEFFILLPQTIESEAKNMCDRIRKFSEGYEITEEKNSIKLSFSMGYSTKTLADEDFSKVITEAENAMRRKKLLERKSVRSNLMTTIKATMLEKSHETAEHAERLVNLAKAIGKEINLSDDEMFLLELAASLHDIGKMGVDQQILTKDGKLTEQEWSEMKKHPEAGYRIALASSELLPISEYILAHHERWDGKGYPQGLKGEEIPLLARIITIVDSYDAMTEDRPYREAMSKEAAIAELSRNSGTQFDPIIAKVFIDKVL